MRPACLCLHTVVLRTTQRVWSSTTPKATLYLAHAWVGDPPSFGSVASEPPGTFAFGCRWWATPTEPKERGWVGDPRVSNLSEWNEPSIDQSSNRPTRISFINKLRRLAESPTIMQTKKLKSHEYYKDDKIYLERPFFRYINQAQFIHCKK